MGGNWRKYCRIKDAEVDGETVVLTLPGERKHRIRVLEEGDVYRLTSLVARASTVNKLEDLPVHVWQRNRGTELVAFKIDAKNRLIGESWVPKAGLTASEFCVYLRTIAIQCDRFEFQLTGTDAD